MARLKRIRSKGRHARIMLWSALIIALGAMVLPLSGYMYIELVADSATAQESQSSNPRSNYWRAVREGKLEGYTAASGPYTTNVLVQDAGQEWRQMRNGPISNYGPAVLIGMLLIIFLFHAINGKVRVSGERSGKTVKRWSAWERLLHWYTAILFIVLSITGLSILFGRAVLIPWLGPEGFAAYAAIAVQLHNYLGPFFVAGIALEVLAWIWFNFPTAVDFKWFAKGGGLVGDAHPSAGRMNAGEKVWFWIIATFGVAVCVTGVIMDFPIFGLDREAMQLSNVIHSAASIVWVAVALGHIYIGTMGTEGSFEGMITGRVSSEWARQHHDLWYEKVKDTEQDESAEASSSATSRASS